ncbi:type II secretion system F family protein [Streptomyces sp. NBC_00079]|uniref:type II secretion system F family protein n=1 Tax=Streptomyces sp. NBC_00079 TaxID=2975644 RepID=UPI003243ED2B
MAVNPYVILFALFGLGIGTGLLLAVHGWRERLEPHTSSPEGPDRRRQHARREHAGRWLTASLVAGVLFGSVTGWVVGALLAAMATWSLPTLIGLGAIDQQRLARIEGIAGWTEMLRDTLAAAAGLEQSITATAGAAPKTIRPQILELSAHLEHGERLAPSLRKLADDLDDPTADLVLAALILASQHQARHLAALLGELAATARAQVAMRQRVDAARARTRTTMRVVVTTTLSFAGGLILLNPAFLSPYRTLDGQLVLLIIGALFALAFRWLRRLALIEGPERFLIRPDGASDSGLDRASASVRQGVAP